MVKSSIWSVLLTVQNLSGYFTGRIAPDERVLFFPTSASQFNATHWQVPIHGWIFQPKENSKKRRAFRSLLRRALKVPSKSSEERILDHRIRSFVVDNERWKRPKIRLNGKEYSMLPSSKNGHFQTTLMVSERDLYSNDDNDNQSTTRPPDSVDFFALSSDGQRRYEGTIHLIPPQGITILSDIDDTIKLTNVTSKREMLRNTFMREFQAVPGMSDLYQKWCRRPLTKNDNIANADADDDGPKPPHVHLHLLSASLYQLYEDLEEFRTRSGFPRATFSLKTVRPKKTRQMIQTLLEDPLEFKRRALTRLFHTYPQRHFVLVGDTGEKDPQVYASMAKEYPQQVLTICLRSVSKGPDDNVSTRVQQIMNDYEIDDEKWTIFEDPSIELMQMDLPKLLNDHQATCSTTSRISSY
jgi:hypothetical protein